MSDTTPIRENGRLLIVTVGLPRSGKSTWARSTGHPIVEPDAVRWAVYGQRYWGPGEYLVHPLSRMVVKALFFAGHKTVVLDEVGIERWIRDKAYPHKDDMIHWDVAFKYFDTSPEVCKMRALETNQEDLLPVIDMMHERFEPLEADEPIYYGSQ